MDTQGNVYFGFEETGSNPSGITDGGIARISAVGRRHVRDGLRGRGHRRAKPSNDGNWTAAIGSAPALSNDGSILYVAVDDGGYSLNGDEYNSYLVGVNSTTLAPEYSVQL